MLVKKHNDKLLAPRVGSPLARTLSRQRLYKIQDGGIFKPGVDFMITGFGCPCPYKIMGTMITQASKKSNTWLPVDCEL